MTVTLHKSQVHSSGVMHWLVMSLSFTHSCPFVCLQAQVAKLSSGLFCCWSSLRNSHMATNVRFKLR